MTQQTENSEAPAETSGAETNPNAVLSLEDLAASFVEKVEETKEEEQSSIDSDEGSPEPDEVDAGEDQAEVLSQSNVEDDDSEEPEESEEDEQPKGIQKALKRINTLTARAKTAEEEVQNLKDEIQSIKSNASETQTQPEKPALENVNTIQDLEALRKEAQAAKKWALTNIGRDYVEVDGKEYEDQDIRNILSEAEDFLSEKIPARASFLQEKQNWATETASTFPWVKEADGPDYELFLQVREGPQYKSLLDTLPNGDFVAGVLVSGINALKTKAKAKPKAPAKTPPPAQTGDAAAPPPEGKDVRLRKKKQAALPEGRLSEGDLADFLLT
ncbi:hypothetical protein OAK38_06175 [Verrucomicrobia bacterium]|nr:hypothetical protein [Verrucomicrobiota bacterium]